MSGTELSESKAAPALAKCMVELARMADKAEALEAKGKYREAAELVAKAMNSAHAEYVQARYPGVTLVRQPSTTMPRRSWAERYKARLRVDWQRWERMSMRTLVSAAVAANNRPSGASSSSDDEEEAPAPAPLRPQMSMARKSIVAIESGDEIKPQMSMARKSIMSRDGEDGDEGGDWKPKTLETHEEHETIELVHTCCDGTKIKNSVNKFVLPNVALVKFNRDPKKTMKGLYGGDPDYVGENGRKYTHEEIARWLLTSPKLSKNKIGDYLGRADEDATKTLSAFLQPLDFAEFSFDEALRFFLSLFRLPGEAQQIDRIMQNFAEKYYEGHPDKFNVADTAYILAFSLIMLNTDAHSDQIEHKMSLQQFLRNNQGIDEGSDLDKEMMTQLYHSIVKNEIRMEQREFITSVKEGWLLKQGGRIKTWKKRYTILSGNVLYYFKSPKDKAPAGFVPLEGIKCHALSDKRTFEIRSAVEGGNVKSVRMETEGDGCFGFGGGGGKKSKGPKKGGLTHGNHSFFAWRTVDEKDSVDAWVAAVIEHAIVDSLASAKASAKSNAPSDDGGFGKATLSFFRGGANSSKPSKSSKGSSTMEPIPEPGELPKQHSDRL